MVEGLAGDKRRQATDAIRGYVYQAHQSVLAWMRLGEEEVLFLEGAEDFDVHSADGVTATQVKDTAGSGTVTLRSGDVVDAINHLWLHKKNNPDTEVRLRFLTTASPGREQGGTFGGIPGIEYWSLAKRDHECPVEPLKLFLLPLNLESSLADFLRSSDDDAIRQDLICRLDWDTGSKPIAGLVADIQDRLVRFGNKRNIDNHQSEKVLDTLLRYIADLLSLDANEQRRLRDVDFVRVFDQATMELVPRAEVAALRRAFSQIPQLAQIIQNPILADLTIAPRVLGSPMRLMQGAASRADLVLALAGVLRRHRVLFLRGSTGLGKTMLAQLLIEVIGGEWVWAEFRGREPRQIADHLKRAAFEIQTHGLPLYVVLDDLDLGSLAQFERELLSLVFSIANQDGIVVVTGPTACPSNLLAQLWLPQDCDQEVPYFDESDVRDVFIRHGLSDPRELELWSRITWVFTAGHPQLIHARARNLQSQGWPSVAQTDLLQTEDLEQVRTTARRRLVDELPSEGVRYIAYRLNLITGEFSRQTVLDLAQIPPPVALPGEAFEGIVGPWIETLGNNRYRISPLLSNAGNMVLSGSEQTAVHEAIAFGFLKRRTITPLEFATALMHALIAKSDGALLLLGRAALTFDHETSSTMSDTVFWFPAMALAPGQHLSTNPATDFIIRLAQFRIAAAGRQTDRALIVMDRALELLQQIEHEELAQAMEASAYAMFLNAFELPIPPSRSIGMLARLMDLQESNEHWAEIANNFRPNDIHNLIDFRGLSPFQILFSFEASRISGIDHLDEFLDALNVLNEEKRQRLIAVLENGSGEIAALLIISSWWKDVSRDALNIRKALTTFRKAIDLAQAWSSPSLVRASYVAMAVMYDEYDNAPDEALAILDEATGAFGATDVYLLKQRAMVLFHQKQYEGAAASFDQALARDGLDNVEKAYAGRTGGIAAAYLDDWSAAERFFLMGSSAAEEIADLKSMAAGLKADAAFARWKQGRHIDALRLYAEILELLEDIPIDEDLKTRHVHAAVRHCLGWIALSAQDTSETDLVAPPPGACSNPEPHEGLKDRSLTDMSAVWAVLGIIDTRLETGLNLMHQAEQKSGGTPPLIVRIRDRVVRYEALWHGKDLPRAVPIIIDVIESNQGVTLDAGRHGDGVPNNITPLPDDYWKDRNNRADILFRLISVGVVGTCLHPNSPLPVTEWLDDVRLHHITGPEVDRFFALLTSTKNQVDGSLLEEAVLALRRIREDTLSPKELCICHFQLLNALFSGDWGKPVGDALAKIVAAQWANVSANQRFALTSPSLYAPMPALLR